MAIFKKRKFEKIEVDTPEKLGWAIALLGGVLMGLTTAPVNAWVLAWFALVPLWVLVVDYQQPKPEINKSKFFFIPSSFFLLPLLWGIGYHGLALSWIMGIHPMTWLGVPWWPSLAIALFCWAFITLWGAALVAVWTWLFVTFNSLSLPGKITILNSPPLQGGAGGGNSKFSSLIRVLIGTALWCALESFWSQGSLWWTSLSYTQSPHNLAILHLGQLSGPSAVTAAIVAVNGLIAEAWMEGRRTPPYPPQGGKEEETAFGGSKNNFPTPPQGGKEEETFKGGSKNNFPPYPPQGGMEEESFKGGSKNNFPPYPEGGKEEETFKGGSKKNPPLRSRGETREKNWIAYFLPGILCLTLHLVGWSLYNRPLIQAPGTALKIGIIQGNIPNEIKFDSQGWRRALEGYTAGYKQLADRGVDVVLTPETALPFFWTNEYQRSTLSFYQAILDRGILAWIGGFGQEGDGMTNSLLAIDKSGEILSRYDKAKLVPLGEYIPFYEILGGIINRLSPLDAHLIPGNSQQLFDTPFGRAIVGICYDSAFAEIFRYQAAKGGEFMVTASNNAHYKPPMLEQHHALDVMRAIETDRWAVIATNTGYSAFVNPRGETLWMSGINTYEVKDATIYRRQNQTLYVRWGDWLMPLLLVLGGFAAIWQRLYL